jgi:DNA repair exonuclease SbcCD nuclease subunit
MSVIEFSSNEIKYPYAVISDVHCHNWSAFSHTTSSGINNRLLHILEGIELAATVLLASGGTDLVLTGDLFHTRGNVKPSVLNPTIDLFKTITTRGIKIHAIPGNHDLEGINSDILGNALHSLCSSGNFTCYTNPTYLASNHLFIPWFEDAQKVLKLANQKVLEKPNLTLFAHVGLNKVIPGHIGNTLNPDDFLKEQFKYVFCGHFHNHVNFDDRVYSVGALTHQTWNDVGSRAGFLIVHEDRVEQHETYAPKFIDVFANPPEGNYVRITGVTFEEDEAARAVATLKEHGALAVLDQSTRPAMVVKDHSEIVKVDLGIDAALESYCKHTYGDKWERVLKECLRLKS